MRMKTIVAIRVAAQWIQRLLDVRLPVDVVAGLNRAERRF